MNYRRLSGMAVVAVSLAACGGGGDDSKASIVTAAPPPTLVLQASAGDLTKYESKFFNSGCGVGVVGAKPLSGYSSFSFGTATTSIVTGFYNFTPSGILTCDGSSTASQQTSHFDMTYVGTTTVASSNASAIGVADVFSLRDKITRTVTTQTFAFDATYKKLYSSNATAAFTSSSLPHITP